MAEVARSAAYRRGIVGRTFGHLLDSEKVFGYALVAPAIIYIVLLIAYPFAIALWFTVTDATVGDPRGKFIGLGNLIAILDDDIFKRALANTFIFTLTSQALQMVFGTTLAFLLMRKFPFRRTIRALILLPFTIPVAIGAMAWNWMLNPTYSVINWVGERLGLFQYGPNWLGEEKYAMASIILVNVWRNLPFTAIVLMAGRGATISLFLFPVLLFGALVMLRALKSRQLD